MGSDCFADARDVRLCNKPCVECCSYLTDKYTYFSYQLLSLALAPWQTGYFSVRVSDSSYIVDHEDECVAYDEEEFPAGSSVALPCKETKYGRYLSIQRTRARTVSPYISV